MTDYLLQNIMLYTLVFFRVAGFFAVAPFFGRSNFPVFGKIILALLCAAIITPMVNVPKIGLEWSNLVVMAIKETALGLMLGFVGYILFTSIYLAGQMIDMQMGFGMVNVLDPQNNIQVPIMGNFLYILFCFLKFHIYNLLIYLIVYIRLNMMHLQFHN